MLQVYCYGLACAEILVHKVNLVVDAFAGVVPHGRIYTHAVYPYIRAFAVPVAVVGRFVLLATAVVLELNLCAHGLCCGAVYVCPGVGCGIAVVCAAVVGGDDVVAPGVAQVDTGACCHTCVVGCTVVGVAFVEKGCACVLACLFGGEYCRCVTTVGEGVGDAPAYVCLFYIGDGLVFQRVGFVEEETAFPVGKLVELLAAVGEHCTAFLNVFFTATNPSTLGTCNYVGVHIVLFNNVGLGGSLAVVPVGRNCSSNLFVTLLHIVDVAAVDTHNIGKHVEVVGVVVTAVDIGFAGNL